MTQSKLGDLIPKNFTGYKFMRGQVWWIEKDENEEQQKMKNSNDHLISKSRPWVIINHTTYGNKDIISAVPLSRNAEPNFHHRVPLMFNGSASVAKCEEVQTFNRSDFTTYIGTLNDIVMEAISSKIANRYGISMRLPSLKNLEDIIDRIIEKKNLLNKGNGVNDKIVLDIVDKLEDLYDIEKENSQHINDLLDQEIIDDEYQEEEILMNEDDEEEETEIIPASKKKKSGKRKYHTWDPPMMKEFLHYLQTNGTAATAERYGITKSTVNNNKTRFLNKI
ncbi:MAG: type II toxin-antitoxin system PemK/MazF family toxin [Candidatus Izemoplasmatales bacterium]|nr:type II toxin-antitoxin system PemK/MazF family toxin [Candidatus Izemoplasmatales bacterium]